METLEHYHGKQKQKKYTFHFPVHTDETLSKFDDLDKRIHFRITSIESAFEIAKLELRDLIQNEIDNPEEAWPGCHADVIADFTKTCNSQIKYLKSMSCINVVEMYGLDGTRTFVLRYGSNLSSDDIEETYILECLEDLTLNVIQNYEFNHLERPLTRQRKSCLEKITKVWIEKGERDGPQVMDCMA